jgi:tetratricopeptide (TPR) repeat protein
MKTSFPLFLLFLALSLRALAQADDPFSQANRAFAESRYDDAIQGYETLLAQQGASAPVLFDLGNAYFRTGKIGQALVHYERARLLAPRDPDLLANETLVANKAGLAETESRWRQGLRFLSPDEWAWLLAGTVVLACVGFFTTALRPALGGPLRLWNGLLVLAAVAAATAGTLQTGSLHRAWVIEADAPVRISPFTEAKAAFTLPDGAAVTVKGAHDTFFLIRDAKGASGWIDGSQLAPLLVR